MRRSLLAALAAVLLCVPTSAAGGGPGPGPGLSAGSAPRPVLSAPLNTSGMWPETTTCGPSLFCYATASAWVCWDGLPGAAGVSSVAVTQGAGTTYETTPFIPGPSGTTARYAARINTDAKAAKLTTPATFEDLFNADHTILYSGTTPAGAGDRIALNIGVLSTSGWHAYDTATNHLCAWNNAGADVAPSQAWASGAWGLLGCRRSGDNFSTLTPAGNTTVASAAYAVAPPTGSAFWFGRHSSAGLSYGAPLGFAAVYRCALTDAEYTRAVSLWFGTVAESRNVTVTRASPGCWEAPDGYVYCSGNNAGSVDATGIQVRELRTNEWLNSLTATSWADQGSPTDCMAAAPANCNSESGPASRYNGSAEADTVGDDTAVGFEGGAIIVAGATTGTYTTSIYAKAGTATAMRLETSSDGTGGGYCNFTTMDTAPAIGAGSTGTPHTPTPAALGFYRYACTATITGVPTYRFGRFLIGNAAAATGTLILSAAQLEPGASPSPWIPAVAAAVQRAADAVTVPTVGWPVAAGAVSITVRPYTTVLGTQAVLDWGDNANAGGLFFTDSGGQNANFRTRAASGSFGGPANGVSPMLGATDYTWRGWWGGGSVFLDKNGARVGSISGDPDMPTANATTARIGARIAGDLYLPGAYRDLRVWSAP